MQAMWDGEWIKVGLGNTTFPVVPSACAPHAGLERDATRKGLSRYRVPSVP